MKRALFLASIAAIAALVGCSNRLDEPNTRTHPPGWMDHSSASFHGHSVEDGGANTLEACRTCHGEDMSGGSAGVACAPCHMQVDDFCASCHGGVNGNNGAPPYDLSGNVDEDSIGVGYHQPHVQPSDVHRPFGCYQCHPDVTIPDAFIPTHIDNVDGRDVLFAVFDSSNAGVEWDHDLARCSDTYCHGNFAGGSRDTMVWTPQGVETTLPCGSCHTQNPTHEGHEEHVEDMGFPCGTCHDGYVQMASVDTAYHVNGSDDVMFASWVGDSASYNGSVCSQTVCHGAASPNWHNAYACGDCHAVPPTSNAHGAHLDMSAVSCATCHNAYPTYHINGTVNVIFTPELQGASYAGGTCSGVECHGSLNGVVWTSSPSFTCTSCHGGVGGELLGVPPYALGGDSTNTQRGVGAHRAMVYGLSVSDGVPCTECHASPSGFAHLDALPPAADFAWGPLATDSGAVSPSFNATDATCSDVYCHGNFAYGLHATPTFTDPSTALCGTCHALPPPDPHPNIVQCWFCHSSVVNSSYQIIGPSLHVNGQTDF